MVDPNRALFERVVQLLAPILDELVFIGGCTTGLLITDPAAVGVRATRDVDAIVDVTSYAQYATLAGRLRGLGLVEDPDPEAPVCRWRLRAASDVIVDVMPTDETILGFSNRWYAVAIETAQVQRVANHEVRIVSPPLFLATKLEAYRGRGGGDLHASHDLEDIVTVVDGRPEIVGEVATADLAVRESIAKEMRLLLGDPNFEDAVAGFLLPDEANQARRAVVIHRLQAMSEMGDR